MRRQLYTPYVLGSDHRPIPYQYENVVKHLDTTRFGVTCFSERHDDSVSTPQVSEVTLPPTNTMRRRSRMLRVSLRQCDVLQTGGSPIARYFLAKAAHLRNPGLRHIHTFHIDIGNEDTRRRRFKRRLASLAGTVVAVSEHTARTAERRFDVTPRVIYNGIDVEYFRPDRSPPTGLADHLSDSVFLFVGKFERRKRPLDVIKVARRIPDSTFLLRGGGSLSDALTSAAADLDNVVLLDRLEKAVLTDLYANVTGLLFPSTREGCPTVVLEALASGAPVIGYDATSMPELISDGETGYLHDVGDIDGLVDAVRSLSDPAVSEEMGAQAREYAVANHRFDRIAQQYQTLYAND